MKNMVAVVLISLMATPATALLDEDKDMMGVYLDMTGDTVCGVNTGIFTMYLLYTNPTLTGVRGFACEIDLRDTVTGFGPAGMWFPAVFPTPAFSSGEGGLFSVRYRQTLGTGPVTLLATQGFYSMHPDHPIDVFLLAGEHDSASLPLPTVLDADFGVMYVGLSNIDGFVAQIGAPECTVVDNEEASFGAVKALFR